MKNMVKQYSIPSHFQIFNKLKYFNRNYSFHLGKDQSVRKDSYYPFSPLIKYK